MATRKFKVVTVQSLVVGDKIAGEDAATDLLILDFPGHSPRLAADAPVNPYVIRMNVRASEDTLPNPTTWYLSYAWGVNVTVLA